MTELLPEAEDTTRAAWLAWRRGGIGASEIAAVCGLSPWASPLSVYLHKTGALPDDLPPTEAMSLGVDLEHFVADQFTKRSGLHVVGAQTWCEHPELSWARCTVDGFVAESPTSTRAHALGIFESKTTGSLHTYEPVPDHVELQVQWQMFVCELEHAWLCVLGGGHRLGIVVVELHRDDAAIEAMVRAGAAMWERIELQQPPPIEAFYPGDAHDLADAFSEPDPDAVVELDDCAELVAELRQLKADAAAVDRQLKRTENALKARLGNAEAGTLNGQPVVTWRGQDRHGIDITRLRAEQPAIAEQYESVTSSRRFLVK